MGVEEGTGAERMAVRESHGPSVARAKVKKNIYFGKLIDVEAGIFLHILPADA